MNKILFSRKNLIALSLLMPLKMNAFSLSCPVAGDGFGQKLKSFTTYATVAWIIVEVGYRRWKKLTTEVSPLKIDPISFIKDILEETLRESGQAQQNLADTISLEDQIINVVEAALSKRKNLPLTRSQSKALVKELIMEELKDIAAKHEACPFGKNAVTE